MLDGLSPLQILPTVFYSFPTTLVIAVVQSLKSYLTLVDPMDYSMHARLPCPSLSPKVCSGSCPLSRWCYLTISSSATSFFFCLQSFPASGSFTMSWRFASGDQSNWELGSYITYLGLQLSMMDSGVKTSSVWLQSPTLFLLCYVTQEIFIFPLTIFNHSLCTSRRYEETQRSADHVHPAANPFTTGLKDRHSHCSLLIIGGGSLH